MTPTGTLITTTVTLRCGHTTTGTHLRRARPYLQAWCPRCRQQQLITQTHHYAGWK